MTEDLLLNLPPGSLGAGVPFYPSTEVSLAAARLIAQAEQIQAGIVAYPDDAVIGVPVGGGGALPESITDDFAVDSGKWLDGNLAPAAMTIASGRGIWTPTEGAELHVSANAASDPNGNEADATTGWNSTEITLTSQSTDKSTGDYALNLAAADGANDRIEYPASNGQWTIFRADAKQVTGTKWRLHSGHLYPTRLQITDDWMSYVVTGYSPSAFSVYGLWCDNGAGGDVGRLDNVSIKPLTPATLYRVRRIYYPSAISARVWWPPGIQAGVVMFQNVNNWIMANRYHYRTLDYIALTKCVAGTVTQVTQSVVAYVAGTALRLIPSADMQAWTVKHGETTVHDAVAITDFAATGTWYAGLFTTYDAGDTDVVGFDDFSATRVAGAAAF